MVYTSYCSCSTSVVIHQANHLKCWMVTMHRKSLRALLNLCPLGDGDHAGNILCTIRSRHYVHVWMNQCVDYVYHWEVLSLLNIFYIFYSFTFSLKKLVLFEEVLKLKKLPRAEHGIWTILGYISLVLWKWNLLFLEGHCKEGYFGKELGKEG